MTGQIGKYHIVEQVGRGTTGTVFKARDPILDRVVAIKIISSDGDVTDELRARFFREAQACARLSHPNIVTVYDIGEEAGRLYIVMEFLEGEELRVLIAERRPSPLEDKLAIMIQVCDGLHYAHQHGIVHRDIKPGNIILLHNGLIKILDFGIAHIASAEGTLTRTGLIMGTLRYIAPEQARGRADQRSDLFSVGAVFYELLAGRAAFPGDDPIQILEQLGSEEPPPLLTLDPTIPPALATIIERAMRKNPAHRFPDLADMRAQLDDVQRHLAAEAQRVRQRLQDTLEHLCQLQAALAQEADICPADVTPRLGTRPPLAAVALLDHDLAARLAHTQALLDSVRACAPAVALGLDHLHARRLQDAVDALAPVVATLPDHARAEAALREAQTRLAADRQREAALERARECEPIDMDSTLSVDQTLLIGTEAPRHETSGDSNTRVRDDRSFPPDRSSIPMGAVAMDQRREDGTLFSDPDPTRIVPNPNDTARLSTGERSRRRLAPRSDTGTSPWHRLASAGAGDGSSWRRRGVVAGVGVAMVAAAILGTAHWLRRPSGRVTEVSPQRPPNPSSIGPEALQEQQRRAEDARLQAVLARAVAERAGAAGRAATSFAAAEARHQEADAAISRARFAEAQVAFNEARDSYVKATSEVPPAATPATTDPPRPTLSESVAKPESGGSADQPRVKSDPPSARAQLDVERIRQTRQQYEDYERTSAEAKQARQTAVLSGARELAARELVQGDRHEQEGAAAVARQDFSAAVRALALARESYKSASKIAGDAQKQAARLPLELRQARDYAAEAHAQALREDAPTLARELFVAAEERRRYANTRVVQGDFTEARLAYMAASSFFADAADRARQVRAAAITPGRSQRP